jgi:hypothetical protein
MFQRVLLAWDPRQPPRRSLDVAESFAGAYDAELAVCCLGGGTVEAQAAVGPDASIATIPSAHVERELLRYAHAHGFDLLVVGRVGAQAELPRRLIEWASLPVLVVAEEGQP